MLEDALQSLEFQATGMHVLDHLLCAGKPLGARRLASIHQRSEYSLLEFETLQLERLHDDLDV